MNLAQRLKAWNKGVQRGAASRFAAKLGVGPSAVTMWLKGTRPGEEMLARIANELGISVPEAERLFPARAAALEERVAQLEHQVAELRMVVDSLAGGDIAEGERRDYVQGKIVRGGRS